MLGLFFNFCILFVLFFYINPVLQVYVIQVFISGAWDSGGKKLYVLFPKKNFRNCSHFIALIFKKEYKKSRRFGKNARFDASTIGLGC